ncbi:MAG: GntP family permease [Mogibacterium sp.]|nr:GntP family permease [Mogibacterium sp.]
MALSMIGIIAGILFLIYFVMKGWPLMFIGALSAMIVAVFSGINIISAYLEAYMNGFGGFLIAQIPIFLWGAIFGECYGITGGAKSIARWISKIFKGSNDVLSPMVTIIIVFLAGLLLSYGGVSAIVLMFVMAPLTLELCRESRMPQYMAPGMILGCIATAALAMPGSPQVQNVMSTGNVGVSSMAAAIPGFIAGALIMVLNALYLNWAAKREMAKGNFYDENAEAAFEEAADEELPNPIVALIPMVIVFVMYNFVNLNVNFALMIGIIVAVILMRKGFRNVETFVKCIANACTNGAIVSCGAGAVAGFGSVVAITPAFAGLTGVLARFEGNPLVIAMFAMMLMTLIGGSGPAGLGVGLPVFTPIAQAMGANMNAFARISAFCATTFDTLPTNAGYIAANEICKTKANKSYKYVGVCTVVNTTIGTLVLCAICILFPGLC